MKTSLKRMHGYMGIKKLLQGKLCILDVFNEDCNNRDNK